MSRSKKKTPIHGIAVCESEAKDKRLWHKRMRARERDRLITDPEGISTDRRQVSNRWTMGKDGKGYFPEHEEYMRK